jgi:prolyl-tRNA editing enzyme YbaK/EbsC (Cys-tRNA(Pro) deacylase)
MEWRNMAGLSRIHELLREARVPFTVVPNRSAREETVTARFPERHRAKVVVCVVDGEPIEAVIPVPLAVYLDRLLELAGGREIRMADDEELQREFPGAEATATPPPASVIRQAVFVDVSLASEPDVVLVAGTHVDAIAIRWAEFARTVKPIVGNFAGLPLDRVPAYRLSSQE